MSSDLWVITCYFNPCRYKTKRANFDAFLGGMEDNRANVLVVELAFADEEFELPKSKNVLRLRGNGVMWQKERLLNLAAAALPASCTKIAWLDNDILFDNPNWVQETSEVLENSVVMQPFDWCVRLPRGVRKFDGRGDTYESFASLYAREPALARGGEFFEHGHTGFAWAARRELFDHCGLYDVCLTASGDHLMAHGFAGGMKLSPCLSRVIGRQPHYAKHFVDWGIKARDLVKGRIGMVEGNLLHLWHGDLVDRRYGDLNQEFKTFNFDPDKHLKLDESGLWEWGDAPKAMRQWARTFFEIRREDGDPDAPLQRLAKSA